VKMEEIIIQTAEVKVRLIELQPEEVTPWHFHTEVTDHFFGMSGEIEVKLKDPNESIILAPGVRCQVETGRAHQVVNILKMESSRYLLIQGVGRYDFVRVAD